MKVGAQLYTLRMYTQNEKDFAFSMKEVAKIGYTQVQISPLGPIPAEVIKEICDENGLEIVLTHANPDRLMNETEAVIREHEVLNCKYIGLGAMPDRYRSSEWISHFVKDFKAPAKKLAAAGKLLMYHNHHFEFEKQNGKRIMETLMADFTAEEMGFTLDTYWVQAAGGDVVQWLETLGDRIPCVHLKDMDVVNGTTVMAPVGEGNMNFDAILRTLKKIDKTEHLLVEQDTCLESPFVCLEKSYQYLAAKGFR